MWKSEALWILSGCTVNGRKCNRLIKCSSSKISRTFFLSWNIRTRLCLLSAITSPYWQLPTTWETSWAGLNNWESEGAFTPDANRANDLHFKSMQRRDRQSLRRREFRELKNLNFGGYSRRVNQSGACSSSDVITSGGRKSQTTTED